ncbi:MAG: hypothetical protein ACK5LJ_15945 [Paracoccus sp. (in: a-proteobacteria)]
MQPLTVARIDPATRLFMYPEPVHPDHDGDFVVPGNCVRELPPETTAPDWPRWNSTVPLHSAEFGHPGTGTWDITQDYRKMPLYLTTDGSTYTLDQDHAGESFDGIGQLPAWLTTAGRPGPYHHYIDGAWVLDADEELTAIKQQRILQLSQDCQMQIYAGFTSDALGALHQYPALGKDQQNLTASVLDSTVPGLPDGWQTPFWCADPDTVWDFRMHTADQIQQVGRDGKQRILACLAHNKTLADQVLAASDVPTVLAVEWTDPAANQA